MLLHCSKLLAAKLASLPQSSVLEPAWNSWHGHVVTLDRRKCLLFCHDITRYVLFLRDVRSEDFDDVEAVHKKAFIAALTADGVAKGDVHRASVALGSLQVDSKTDRSVQGTMRTAIEDIRYAFLTREPSVMRLDIAEVTKFLSGRPCTVYGKFIQPNDAMRESIPK